MPTPEHWLEGYASAYHAWQYAVDGKGEACFYRPLGLVERGFDLDGVGYEGRADINATLELDVNTTCTPEQIRRRILLAWTLLRLHHVLLLSKAVFHRPFMRPSHKSQNRYFLVKFPSSKHEAVSDAKKHITFIKHTQKDFDLPSFFHHSQNVARVVKPTEAMAELFVAPLTDGRRIELLLVMGHQISDGLTNYTWLSHFLRLLNTPISHLETGLHAMSRPHGLVDKLPPPQEDLYMPVSGTRARQRWYWAILRVMRHTRRPLPACFQNPLRRQAPARAAKALEPKYDSLLDYTRMPPLNTFTVEARVDTRLSRKLIKLCREANASVGAGSFTLTAMVMMSLYEQQNPHLPLHQRLPFIGGFPVNPRPFFGHHADPDSLMLAFSDGVVLPFLPSHLDFAKRFRLLVRQAHRQLRQYQKRKTNTSIAEASSSSSNVVAQTYLGSFDRLQRTSSTLSQDVRDSLIGGLPNPQGNLPARANPTLATCGISSVGKSGWHRGIYDLNKQVGEGEDAFVADYHNSKQNVRARDGEFLVGVWGESDGTISANVSADGNAIDPELAQQWKYLMETILEQLPEESRM
ncbi:hypothetical protein P389DRAFT_46148 [Cystobasidium minutum MCA 4210]|uniref:uncharacterized protein n=1 Tax=Cystobasidium minutum MCA 4210 TaxID=1397322 RepID=UPI0034CD0906|eukprot:jgi/Rhomi1/46148/CE46147_781